MIETAFISLLTSTPAVANIVDQRVYFGSRPQNERQPGLVLTFIGSTRFRAMQKTSWKNRVTKGRLQIDVLAPTYAQAKQLAQAVTCVLDEFSGVVTDTKFHLITVDDASDIPTAPLQGKAEPTHGVSLDVSYLAVGTTI